MSEDAGIPYVFVASKEELGHASATKRPTSCVMVCPDMKKRKTKKARKNDEKLDVRYLALSGCSFITDANRMSRTHHRASST